LKRLLVVVTAAWAHSSLSVEMLSQFLCDDKRSREEATVQMNRKHRLAAAAQRPTTSATDEAVHLTVVLSAKKGALIGMAANRGRAAKR
jgi:hypothetical protein